MCLVNHHLLVGRMKSSLFFDSTALVCDSQTFFPTSFMAFYLTLAFCLTFGGHFYFQFGSDK